MNCFILDDDEVYSEILSSYVARLSNLKLVGISNNPLKAQQMLSGLEVDLLFSDIEMDELSGIDFVRTLQHKPLVIFTTSHPEFAVEGFELDVLDFLVKPFSFNRFLKSVNKATEALKLNQQNILSGPALPIEKSDISFGDQFFFIRSDSQFIRIIFSEVLYVEAMRDFVKIVTISNTYVSLVNLKLIEEKLPTHIFVRTHRSYLVNVFQINAITSNEIKVGKHSIPLGMNYKDRVFEDVVKQKLLTRELIKPQAI